MFIHLENIGTLSASKFCHLVYCNIFGATADKDSYYKFVLVVGLQSQTADNSGTDKTPTDYSGAGFGTS